MDKIVLAYVPVIHAGYLKFFNNHRGARMGLLGADTYVGAEEFKKLGREIRALSVHTAQQLLRALSIFPSVGIVGLNELRLIRSDADVVMPDEDVSRFVGETYLEDKCQVTYESVFLRFDLPQTLSQVPPVPDQVIAPSEFDRQMIQLAYNQVPKSPDWWRQVGGVVVRDGEILYTGYNCHMPSEHSLYALGDPRNNFVAGEKTEMSCAHHAERNVIAKAARDGVPLLGASLYLTVFPCPACAYSIVVAGIKKIYYRGGYSQLQAAETCKAHGVELIYVGE